MAENMLVIVQEKWLKQLEIIRHRNELDGKAIYIEDLWGKIEFKGKEAESLFQEIGPFISEVKRNHCKIIITSREKLFDEFEKKKETIEDVSKYVNELKIGLSYTQESLTQILKNYINVFEPKWGKNEKLKEIAYEAIEKKLKTPMSIKKLIESSKYIEDINDLRNEIEKAAEETKITFAKEIKEIFNREDYDKIVFLSFPYIIVEPEIAKLCYQEVVKDLGYSINAKDFDDLFKEFNEVELAEVGYLFQSKVTYSLSFVHPSYREAFKYALTDNGKPNNISKKIFSNVLLKLNEIDENIESVGWCLISNFEDISEVVRNKLLPSIAKNDLFDVPLAYIIYSCYSESRSDIIYENIRYNLMFKLSENDDSAEPIAWILMDHFFKIPEDVRNNLLLKLSEKITASDFVAQIVAENFDKLPEDVRNILFKFSENDETAEDVAETVSVDFDRLPEDVRNRLLLKLSNTVASEWVAQLVAENFDKLPEYVRNLLDKLQKELEFVIEELDHDSLKKVNLISKVRTKINRDFALKKLDELSKDKNEEVRHKAETLKEIFS